MLINSTTKASEGF